MSLRESFLYWIVLAFAGGVVVNELSSGSTRFFWLLLIVTFISGIFALILSKKRIAVFVLMILCATLLGFGRNELVLISNTRKTSFDELIGQKISFTGVLVEEQEKRDFNTRLLVRVTEINGEKSADEKITAAAKEKIKILVTTGSPKDFRYGGIVKVKGKLVVPENFYTDTGREFDYVGYLASSDVRFLVKDGSVYVSGYDPPSKILAGLFFAKRAFVDSLKKALPAVNRL